jgi:hypothetical protein
VTENARLILETHSSFPIILSSSEKVMDGMHRVCNALIKGKEKIKTVQFSVDPQPDFEDIQSPDDLLY